MRRNDEPHPLFSLEKARIRCFEVNGRISRKTSCCQVSKTRIKKPSQFLRKMPPKRKSRPSDPYVRPLLYLPAASVAIFVVAMITMYSLFLASTDPPRDLVVSRVLSIKLSCSDVLLATFVPNVGTLGLGSGIIVIELVFLLRFIKNRPKRRGAAGALFVVGTLASFFMLWMLAFPTGRGAPFDLFHQVTAGISVFLYMVHSVATAATWRNERPILRRAVAGALVLSAVAMAIAFVLEMFNLAPSNLFAAFQFAYLGFLLVYFLSFTDGVRFSAKQTRK